MIDLQNFVFEDTINRYSNDGNHHIASFVHETFEAFMVYLEIFI